MSLTRRSWSAGPIGIDIAVVLVGVVGLALGIAWGAEVIGDLRSETPAERHARAVETDPTVCTRLGLVERELADFSRTGSVVVDDQPTLRALFRWTPAPSDPDVARAFARVDDAIEARSADSVGVDPRSPSPDDAAAVDTLLVWAGSCQPD